jgi:hypothetical protein
MANLNNPVNVLYQDETTGQPVPVRQDTPLPVSATIEAEIGDWAVATEAAPTYVEAAPSPGSVDLTGNMRVIDAAAITLLTSLLASIGAAGDAAGDNTVIGQLKQIAENTTPTP